MNLLDKALFTVGKPFAKRFVAGDTMEDALVTAKALNEQGFETIINFLGEETKDKFQVWSNVKMYSDLIKAIRRKKLKSRIALKPSQLGLEVNQHFYKRELIVIARDAISGGVPLEIDMEAESTVEATIRETISLAKYLPNLNLRQAVAMNFKDSFVHLYNLTANNVKVRLCKGAYPSKYSEKEVSQRYISAALYLSPREINPDFATHDLALICLILAAKNKYHSSCGFQFLFGLGKKTWQYLLQKNEKVAIYVPFGKNWVPYAKRRWKYIIRNIPSILVGY